MAFTLYLNQDRWRAHQRSVWETNPGLVPVTKGNGYGFGNQRLAHESAKAHADLLAVGTLDELRDVTDAFAADVLVLTPYRVSEDTSQAVVSLPDRVVRTVSSVDGALALGGRRIVIECRTSLCRHGVTEEDLPKLRAALDDVRLEGFALHLPLEWPKDLSPLAEVTAWVQRLRAASMPPMTMFVSHLSPHELTMLSSRYPETRFRPRIGTRLWLGDRDAFAARGTVLDVVQLRRGQRCGYRQRRVRTDGHLVVVSGGTAHGVGLEAPKWSRGLGTRLRIVGSAALSTANRYRSPFMWAGERRWFAEPPHMQVSMLFVPKGTPPPAIGDELDLTVRMTTTHFDRVLDL